MKNIVFSCLPSGKTVVETKDNSFQQENKAVRLSFKFPADYASYAKYVRIGTPLGSREETLSSTATAGVYYFDLTNIYTRNEYIEVQPAAKITEGTIFWAKVSVKLGDTIIITDLPAITPSIYEQCVILRDQSKYWAEKAKGYAESIEADLRYCVNVSKNQTFTNAQKLQGRTNIGLSNVDNTSDMNKPISTATQNALNKKADKINDTVISKNADLAEVGEWSDGNPTSENRIGYFAVLHQGVNGFIIDKATSTSDVCGVIVNAPAFSGNTNNKYDANGNLKKQYDYIAMMGLVSVIDNGACSVPGRCMPSNDGTAIPSTNLFGFSVISRIDANHIEVFIRPAEDTIKRISDAKQNKLSSENAGTNITITEVDGITKISSAAPSATWGNINGNIEDQEDLVEYVDENGGKIDTIKRNGTALPITNKTVNISVPTKTSDLQNDSNFAATSDVSSAVYAEANLRIGADNTLQQNINSEASTRATADTNLQTQINNKVEKVTGKGLSTNDFSDLEKEKLDNHVLNTNNPHGVTKTQLGLGNVDNTSDINKPVSTATQTALNAKVNTSDIVDNTSSTAANKPLSANMGKELQDEINNLKSRGRFLSLWNCASGLAQSVPTVNPYTYRTGDYFIIGTIASTGETNYKPNGATYDKDVPSTTVETAKVAVGDVYYYDGTNWILQINTQKELTFANIAGSPFDNSELAAALNGKQNTLTTAQLSAVNSGIDSTKVGQISTNTTNISTLETSVGTKASKVTGATNGDFAGLDSNGNLTDSGKRASDFATAAQGIKADTAEQVSNKTNILSSSSTTTQYPNASIVYNEIKDTVLLDGDATQLSNPLPINANTLENHPASYFATAIALSTKQDSTDNTLTTTSKQIVGAINELNSGKQDKTIIKSTMDAVLVANTQYDLGTQSYVTLTLPSTATSCQEIYIAFKSGATATTLNIVGDYEGDTSYLPSTNCIVEMHFKYICSSWVLVVKETAVTSS